MILPALALIFFGIACMFFYLWKAQDTAFKIMYEEHNNTRRHIERLSVRCATLSAQLDDLVAASNPQATSQMSGQMSGQTSGQMAQPASPQDDFIPTLPKLNL